MIAKTPKPPYYAVIFTSIRTEGDNGYSKMTEEMVEMVKKQPGFLGFESAREDVGITISYWKDLKSIEIWKNNVEHKIARIKGKEVWYKYFKVRIAKVDKDYSFEK